MKQDNKETAMVQNLKDAGCDMDTIENFMEKIQKKQIGEGLRLLAIHRRTLLDDLHKDQKQIDCLDYLIYQMEKVQKEHHI